MAQVRELSPSSCLVVFYEVSKFEKHGCLKAMLLRMLCEPHSTLLALRPDMTLFEVSSGDNKAILVDMFATSDFGFLSHRYGYRW